MSRSNKNPRSSSSSSSNSKPTLKSDESRLNKSIRRNRRNPEFVAPPSNSLREGKTFADLYLEEFIEKPLFEYTKNMVDTSVDNKEYVKYVTDLIGEKIILPGYDPRFVMIENIFNIIIDKGNATHKIETLKNKYIELYGELKLREHIDPKEIKNNVLQIFKKTIGSDIPTIIEKLAEEQDRLTTYYNYPTLLPYQIDFISLKKENKSINPINRFFNSVMREVNKNTQRFDKNYRILDDAIIKLKKELKNIDVKRREQENKREIKDNPIIKELEATYDGIIIGELIETKENIILFKKLLDNILLTINTSLMDMPIRIHYIPQRSFVIDCTNKVKPDNIITSNNYKVNTSSSIKKDDEYTGIVYNEFEKEVTGGNVINDEFIEYVRTRINQVTFFIRSNLFTGNEDNLEDLGKYIHKIQFFFVHNNGKVIFRYRIYFTKMLKIKAHILKLWDANLNIASREVRLNKFKGNVRIDKDETFVESSTSIINPGDLVDEQDRLDMLHEEERIANLNRGIEEVRKKAIQEKELKKRRIMAESQMSERERQEYINKSKPEQERILDNIIERLNRQRIKAMQYMTEHEIEIYNQSSEEDKESIMNSKILEVKQMLTGQLKERQLLEIRERDRLEEEMVRLRLEEERRQEAIRQLEEERRQEAIRQAEEKRRLEIRKQSEAARQLELERKAAPVIRNERMSIDEVRARARRLQEEKERKRR